jgi:hypothetical protein
MIEKDAFDLINSKGIFGMSVSTNEEDELIRQCLPGYEEAIGQDALCYDLEISESPLDIRETAGLL